MGVLDTNNLTDKCYFINFTEITYSEYFFSNPFEKTT